MRVAALVCACAVLACDEPDPLPQWTVVIATDARLPQFGDRLLVEILRGDGSAACQDCRRIFPIADDAAFPLSFGVVPPAATGTLRVRARLFRADHIGSESLPVGGAFVDALGTVPIEPGRVLLSLRLDCFGLASDVENAATCDPDSGLLAPEPTLPSLEKDAPVVAASSWPGLASTPCRAQPPAGMVCVPGGAFVLGHPFTLPSPVVGNIALPERLTVLSPFALDVDEMTVGQVRALYLAGMIDELPLVSDPDPLSEERACAFLGIDDPTNDALSVNCISYRLAAQSCAALGKRLPTEAELEYAAGNLEEESPYPWGYDNDICGHAIVARGRVLEAPATQEAPECRYQPEGDFLPWGQVAGGSDGDVTAQGVRNLGGNMGELSADRFALFSEPCWSEGGLVLHDPRCDRADDPFELRTVRGSSWMKTALLARAPERDLNADRSVGVGFRCALSMP